MSEKIGLLKRVGMALFDLQMPSKVVGDGEEKQNSTLGTLFGMTEGDADEMGEQRYSNLKNYNDKYTRETWVYSGVYAIANDIAGIPVKIYKLTYKNGKEVKNYIVDHPFLQLLKHPNDLTKTKEEFLESILANAELSGNAYVIKDEIENGLPTKLYSMLTHQVEIVRGGKSIAGYKYNVDGTTKEFNTDEIVHYKYFNPLDAHYGLSSISACRMGIQSNEKAGDYNTAFFKNGARPSGCFETESRLGNTEYERLRIQIAENYTGNKNAFKPLILEKGLKYQEIGISSKDMDFINGKKMTREEILACLGVPPARVGVMEYSNYANMKEQMQSYWMNTLVPKMCKLIAILQEILNLWNDGTIIEWDLSNVEAFRQDEERRSKIVDTYFKMGIPMNVLIDWFKLPIEKREDIRGWVNGYLAINLIAVDTDDEADKLPLDEETPEQQQARELKEKELARQEKKLIGKLNRSDDDYKRADIFIERSIPQERKLKGVIREYFSEQEKEVLKKLSRYKQIKMDENIAGEYKFYQEVVKNGKIEKVSIEDIDGVMFDMEKARKEYQKRVLPNHRQAIHTEGEAELERLGLAISFNVENPRVIEFLRKYGLDEATLINDYTKQKLRETLIDGLRAGETIPDLASRVRLVYRDADRSRSITIARTEIIQASNFGALESYKQTEGVVKGWEWLTAKDELVCDECEGVDGDTHELGDSNVPPLHPRCRCSILPLVEK